MCVCVCVCVCVLLLFLGKFKCGKFVCLQSVCVAHITHVGGSFPSKASGCLVLIMGSNYWRTCGV